MKIHFLIILLFCGAISGCEKPPQDPKWEYKIVYDFSGMKMDAINSLGAKGWEVVGPIEGAVDNVNPDLLLKRKLK